MPTGRTIYDVDPWAHLPWSSLRPPVDGVQAIMFAGGTAVFGFVQNWLLKWANS